MFFGTGNAAHKICFQQTIDSFLARTLSKNTYIHTYEHTYECDNGCSHDGHLFLSLFFFPTSQGRPFAPAASLHQLHACRVCVCVCVCLCTDTNILEKTQTQKCFCVCVCVCECVMCVRLCTGTFCICFTPSSTRTWRL